MDIDWINQADLDLKLDPDTDWLYKPPFYFLSNRDKNILAVKPPWNNES